MPHRGKNRNYKSRPGHKKPKLGTGARFKALKKKLSKKRGIKNPGALAAAIGRKKYGKKKFQKLASAGRKKRARADGRRVR